MNDLKFPALEDVLRYSNREVVYRFSKIYGMPINEADEIFEDLKKWLWLSNRRRELGLAHRLSIDRSLLVVDEMWHNFILFTREYAEFCDRHFGRYIHHAPTTEAEAAEHRRAFQQLPAADRALAVKEDKRPIYNFVYEELGEVTFLRWYQKFPKIYTLDGLAEMQLRAAKARVL